MSSTARPVGRLRRRSHRADRRFIAPHGHQSTGGLCGAIGVGAPAEEGEDGGAEPFRRDQSLSVRVAVARSLRPAKG